MDAFLSTAEAARLAGVGTTSVKRWADEGLLACQKTAGGHRRFARDEFERFLRSQGAAGETPEPTERWLEHFTSGNGYALRGALFSARGRLGAWHRVCDELAPALTELGSRWACGEVSVLEEHVASEQVGRALNQASDSLVVDERGPVCLLACAEGDDHTLGLLLAELCLKEVGWAVLWAGRRTPTADIVRSVELGQVQMVALSGSATSDDQKALAAQARRIENACRDARIPLVLGGRGAWPEGLAHARRFTAFEPFASYAGEALIAARRRAAVRSIP